MRFCWSHALQKCNRLQLNKTPRSEVSLFEMETESKWALAAGQIWHTGIATVEILKLGKRLIHYRVTKRLGQRMVSAQISPIQAMESYLREHSAKLIGTGTA